MATVGFIGVGVMGREMVLNLLNGGHRVRVFDVRAEAAERKLRGSKLDDPTIRAASEEAIKGLHPTSDIHGSSEYRIALLQTMTQRALTIARFEPGMYEVVETFSPGDSTN